MYVTGKKMTLGADVASKLERLVSAPHFSEFGGNSAEGAGEPIPIWQRRRDYHQRQLLVASADAAEVTGSLRDRYDVV